MNAAAEVPMETHSPAPQPVGPSASANAMRQEGNMGMVAEGGYPGMAGLGGAVGQEPASQSSDPTSPHTEFGGGIMRIAPTEVNVSCKLLSVGVVVRKWKEQHW